MSCRSVYMGADAKLGGEGEATITPESILELHASFETLGQNVGRSPGELFGPITNRLETFRYTNPNGLVRWDAATQVPKDGGWIRAEKLEVGEGIPAATLLKSIGFEAFNRNCRRLPRSMGWKKFLNRSEPIALKLLFNRWPTYLGFLSRWCWPGLYYSWSRLRRLARRYRGLFRRFVLDSSFGSGSWMGRWSGSKSSCSAAVPFCC